jgi:hypothetical protein
MLYLAGKFGGEIYISLCSLFTFVMELSDIESFETDFSSPTESSFVLISDQGDGGSRIERRLRQSQINVERLSLMFKVSFKTK